MQALQRRTPISSMRRCQSGFTFLELIITIAIGSILLAVAVPSFQALITSNKLTATTNTLVFSLQTARSEAIKRALPAGVCTSNIPLSDDAMCTPGSGYVEGWIAYVDSNGNGDRDSDEEIVMAVEDRGEAFKFNPADAFEDQVYFDESGGSVNVTGVPLSGGIDISFGDSAEKRTVRILATGKITTVVN